MPDRVDNLIMTAVRIYSHNPTFEDDDKFVHTASCREGSTGQQGGQIEHFASFEDMVLKYYGAEILAGGSPWHEYASKFDVHSCVTWLSREYFDTVEAAIDDWGGLNGLTANHRLALELVRQTAANAGTTVARAYLAPSRQEVSVILANGPHVAMRIRVGFVEHRDPTLPNAVRYAEPHDDWWYTPLPVNAIRGAGNVSSTRTDDHVGTWRCACSPWLLQPVGAERCSECDEARVSRS